MIDFLHVTKIYKNGGGIREFDCQIDRGELLVVEGSVASGKTTLVRMLIGIERPDSGRIVVSGTSIFDLSRKEMVEYRRQIGMIIPDLGLLPDRSLLENVALPLYLHGTLSRKAIKHKALDALSAVGLTGRAGHRGKGLSAGEWMRVSLARALASEPALLIFDDPAVNLDRESIQFLLDVIAEEHRQGVTVLITTSVLDIFHQLSPRTIRLEEGRIIADNQFDQPQAQTQLGGLWMGLRP